MKRFVLLILVVFGASACRTIAVEDILCEGEEGEAYDQCKRFFLEHKCQCEAPPPDRPGR